MKSMPMNTSVCDAFPLSRSYDQYYGSGLYSQRYPRFNANMLRLVRRFLPDRGQVLDFGCGNGRYAGPLLEHGVPVTGYDISPIALQVLRSRFPTQVASGQLRTIGGSLSELRDSVAPASFDLALLMFGVIGHVRGDAVRQETLRAVARLVRPGGTIIVTAPNSARRFAQEQAACAPDVAHGSLESGDILYKRHTSSGPVDMYYHLFSPGSFARMIENAGLDIKWMGAESVMPERAVLTLPLGGLLDRALMAVTPLKRTYGFAVAATVGSAG
jgi:tRNA (uracil-5-)-methyltransferase TRM9